MTYKNIRSEYSIFFCIFGKNIFAKFVFHDTNKDNIFHLFMPIKSENYPEEYKK